MTLMRVKLVSSLSKTSFVVPPGRAPPLVILVSPSSSFSAGALVTARQMASSGRLRLRISRSDWRYSSVSHVAITFMSSAGYIPDTPVPKRERLLASGSLFTASREATISSVEKQKTSSLSAILATAFTIQTWESLELLASS